jgi:hypothetical protein
MVHGGRKKQGRRRSMPPTTLPAPDIEIGLRHPVNCILQRKNTDACDPFHKPREKVPDDRFSGGISAVMAVLV